MDAIMDAINKSIKILSLMASINGVHLWCPLIASINGIRH